jgi:hypothetical protein
MIPVRVAQEKNTRNAADPTKRHHCGAHRMVAVESLSGEKVAARCPKPLGWQMKPPNHRDDCSRCEHDCNRSFRQSRPEFGFNFTGNGRDDLVLWADIDAWHGKN